MSKGLKILIALLFISTVYIFLAGPIPPILGVATSDDPMIALQLREDFLKLNEDQVFVRIYCDARDVLAPIVFIMALGLWRAQKVLIGRKWILTGLALSLSMALWSSQKATLINYLIAALIILPSGGRHLLKYAVRALPFVLGLILVIFAVTSAKLAALGISQVFSIFELIWEGVVYRLFVGPMEVAAAYIDAVDNLRLIGPFTVIRPLLGPLFPSMPSVESLIAGEYFYREGLESGSANALAFAYAYVIGGYLASFLGGVVVAACLKIAVRIVRTCHSALAVIAFEAYLAYTMTDLINGNFILYLSKMFTATLVAWTIGEMLRASWRFGLTRTKPYLLPIPRQSA
ncbi:MAG TPA: hypothetical protein VI895_12610 [Bdellovibrionota bacterium]|nr:hypothetical protein [Bdellovibrionota bacterium]